MTVHTSLVKFAGRGTTAVVTPLSVEASANRRSGNAPLAVTFTATSLGGRAGATKSYTWTFGDGTTGSGASLTKTYTTPGSYVATVTVSDGVATATSSVAVTVSAPTQALAATFSASPTSGASPLTVRFTTTPTGGSGSYTVTVAFGDGASGGGMTTSRVYSTPGTYTATATISDGLTSVTRTATVTVSQPVVTPLIVSLSPKSLSGTAPYSVAFTVAAGGGTPPYTYAWTFGDGGTSTLQSPTYSYERAGEFTASVTVRDGTRATTDSTGVSVTSTGVSGPTNFDTWTHKTIPPNNDWVAYGSLEGNPNFDASKLSSSLQTYRNKALVYHRRLLLKEGETTTIPGTSTTRGYIQSGRAYGYGKSGGKDRDWYTAMRKGRSGDLPNVRDWSRFAMPAAENALHIFQLTHDLQFLDFACFWFDGYWDAMMFNCDATATWSGSGRNRSVSVTTNVNGRYGRYRPWLRSYVPNADHENAANWGAVKYWGNAGAPINALWHKNNTMANTRRTKRLALQNTDDAISNSSSDGNAYGTVQVLEDGLITGIWARLLHAVYLNRNNTSPKHGANYYADAHAKMKHYIFDHWIPLWQDDYGIRKPGFQKFNDHPFLYDELAHSYTNICRFYWHVYKYATYQMAATTGSTKTTWTARASDYLDAFIWMGEAVADDWLYYDLKDQKKVDPDITSEDLYDEDVMPFTYPHKAGNGGYDIPYESEAKSWGAVNGWGWGGNVKRRNVGNPKVIYFTQQLDTGMDMYISRYWEELSSANKAKMKTRAGRYSEARDAYHWGDKYMKGIAAMVTYAISTDPSDGSRNKRFWNQVNGSSRVKEGKNDAISANWTWANRHALQTQGQGGGASDQAYTLSSFLQYNVCIMALAFQPYLTGKYRNKFKDAYELEKAAQGGWSVGNTDNITESSLELIVHLFGSKG